MPENIPSRRDFVVSTMLWTLLGVASSAQAFGSTDVESFTDPDYVGFQPKRVLIQVLQAEPDMRTLVEDYIIKEFTKRGLTAIPERQVFIPTRQWTPTDRQEALAKSEIGVAIVITFGASAASVIPVATQTYGSAQAYRTGNHASLNGQATTYNIVKVTSKAQFSALLVDVKEGCTAWYADAVTKASGALFVGDKSDAKSVAGAAVKQLIEDGHIPKK
jgi:hypothetical protein